MQDRLTRHDPGLDQRLAAGLEASAADLRELARSEDPERRARILALVERLERLAREPRG